MDCALSEAEIAERTALLRRFKCLLEEKRAKFQEYINALEMQEKSIAAKDAEKIEQQGILGEAIVSEIYTIQNAIDPIEAMYRDIYSKEFDDGTDNPSAEDAEKLIPKLKADLDKLEAGIQLQNKKNRELLKSAMAQIKGEITQVKNPCARKNVYAAETERASIIDMQA